MKSSLIFIILTLLYCSQASGTIINVPADTSSIQAAINIAADGDTVLVAKGTYIENINFHGKAITVASHFLMDQDTSHISKTIIDGSQPAHADSGSVVFFDSGEDSTSVLCGFTIVNGTGTINVYNDPDFGLTSMRNGGGIFVDSSGAKIKYNIIRDNRIDSHFLATGGGIRAWAVPSGTAVIISNNHILNNVVNVPENSGGGGIDVYNLVVDEGLYFIKNNIIEYNEVFISTTWKAWGGGIANHVDLPFNGRMEISENIIRHNSLYCANTFGAGIYVTFWQHDNRPDNNLNPKIYNNLIYKNISTRQGSAISVYNYNRHNYSNAELSPKPIICNNTIVDNRGVSSIHVYQSVPLVMNNIINNYNNSNCDFYFDARRTYNGVKLFYNAVGDTALLFNNSTQHEQHNNMFDIDPLFNDTLTYQLSAESPCIGKGKDRIQIDSIWYISPSTDIDGNDRPNPIDEYIDLGAIETPYEPPTSGGIRDSKFNFPGQFKLNQNYPNPFNPTTRVTFTLPSPEYLELDIYNILGKKVTTLLETKMNAGFHDVTFNASDLPSGIYFYRIQAGEFSQVKKMVLLR